jgi:hypothetical protein
MLLFLFNCLWYFFVVGMDTKKLTHLANCRETKSFDCIFTLHSPWYKLFFWLHVVTGNGYILARIIVLKGAEYEAPFAVGGRRLTVWVMARSSGLLLFVLNYKHTMGKHVSVMSERFDVTWNLNWRTFAALISLNSVPVVARLRTGQQRAPSRGKRSRPALFFEIESFIFWLSWIHQNTSYK